MDEFIPMEDYNLDDICFNEDYEEFWRFGEKIIFIPEFNKPLDEYYDTISNFTNLVFSNYDWFRFESINRDNFNLHIGCQCDGECGYSRSKFNQPIDSGLLPEQLTQLKFGYYFDQPVSGLLPKQLTHLTFDTWFNQPINNLPDNLIYLKFGTYFNRPIQLNLELTELVFGESFNKPILLNSKLTRLEFGTCFNQPVELPKQLTHLTIGHYFNQPIELPCSLIHLTHHNYASKNIYKLPKSLKILELSDDDKDLINNLPDELEELVLGFKFNLKLSNLPNKLKKLTIHNGSNLLDELPNSLEELVINGMCELNNLPNSIKKIKILSFFYDKELNNLPNSLEYLELPNCYRLQIKNIPSNLKTLVCHKNYPYSNDFVNLNVDIIN
jgi:hypothetical protein